MLEVKELRELDSAPAILLHIAVTLIIIISVRLLLSPYSITTESNVKGHENKGNDHFKMLLIVRQILLVSNLENVYEQYGE